MNKQQQFEESLLNLQRTYCQSPQPALSRRVFESIVHHNKIDHETLIKLAPTIPIYIKQLRRWSPAKSAKKVQEHRLNTSLQKTSRAISICNNQLQLYDWAPKGNCVKKETKSQITNKRVTLPNVIKRKQLKVIPQLQKFTDQMILTPW